jgi:hypothetical protein
MAPRSQGRNRKGGGSGCFHQSGVNRDNDKVSQASRVNTLTNMIPYVGMIKGIIP